MMNCTWAMVVSSKAHFSYLHTHTQPMLFFSIVTHPPHSHIQETGPSVGLSRPVIIFMRRLSGKSESISALLRRFLRNRAAFRVLP